MRLLKCSEALRDFARRIAKRCDLTDLLPTLHCACLITGEPERIAEMQHGRNGWITRCEPQCGAEERDRARAVGTVLQFALAVAKHAERIKMRCVVRRALRCANGGAFACFCEFTAFESGIGEIVETACVIGINTQ